VKARLEDQSMPASLWVSASRHRLAWPRLPHLSTPFTKKVL